MAKNWAIAIGINKYNYLQRLHYAQQDAERVQTFLEREAGFDYVLRMSEEAEDRSFHPTKGNIRRSLRRLAEKAKMGPGDNFWFFFSGHGIPEEGCDYLMPLDGDPDDIKESAIAISDITNILRGCGADNVVLILDACRQGGKKAGKGIGDQTTEMARQTGVISFFSCSPNQYSYEIPELKQGVFTQALLEGLSVQGRCATVERLNEYLTRRVPELIREHGKQHQQTPYTIAEPVSKSHLILLPKYATTADILSLKTDAFEAQTEGNLELAEQLWIRVLAASGGSDLQAIRAIQRIGIALHHPPIQAKPAHEVPSSAPVALERPQKSITPPPVIATPVKSGLKTFSFDGVTVDKKGKETERRKGEAEYFEEDLGDGVTLAMVYIPGGTFMMGSPEGEGDHDEKPQHRVTVPPFFMGKYPVTQAQWRQVAKLPKVKRDLKPDPAYFKGADRPVEQVSWYDTEEFTARLAQKAGKSYRLPSEAEWEYACRAGTATPFHFGETITTDLANYRGTDWEYEGKIYSGSYADAPKGIYREETTPVGYFKVANAFGLYDMHGNVWEWCLDDWHNNYQGAPEDGSAWVNNNDNDNQSRVVLRGGSWFSDPYSCRSAYRNYNNIDVRGNVNDGIGFRVVCVAGRTFNP
ncbi:SUMF1/EgtB/PvdO family nonheme iron enzyme [Desertifilum sp. FACHB-1129]|uniref:SUMF1/EgtB/PvdO family nonheme iron enzyme n=1 Tax=unclassified Desertifilum TaxID=2621682 RepID=UPI001683DCF7|nr:MULTISPECIES: SUMF1/EgtB/PvdO family nonheme iron enzyme [unclassified Desertifilum]MBD2311777.1 SUMF1/EgtB/PvdO family nonheme iron enzyme [Desertifilum sp. FACHB-1129]MBD2333352.1 SUMF1/EgtB/PvdO family nonheme iron enzyme [Desertifilum sp. FACHB-868]MDA0209122.1 SUMF1/EgtB/PvdO family nonheme iron enzyme [Cyanobacteria bacterium FC1]